VHHQLQVGFAVADDSSALHGFLRSLRAPGAMTVPVESTHSNSFSQKLTLFTKASTTVLVCVSVRSLSPQAADGLVSRTAISETLFSSSKDGTCHGSPPEAEAFNAVLAANEVLEIEESIKRCFEQDCALLLLRVTAIADGNCHSKEHVVARRQLGTSPTIQKLLLCWRNGGACSVTRSCAHANLARQLTLEHQRNWQWPPSAPDASP
jgi:hypothetical protein